MMNWTIQHLCKGLDCQIRPDAPDLPITGISFDTRHLEAGHIFVALRGMDRDGHDFIQDALEKSASYILSEMPINHPQIIHVENSLDALTALAMYQRNICSAQYIAITGSVGKTTCKEYLDRILSKQYKSYKNIKNYNNHIGLPFCLAQIPQDAEIGLFEMGMSAKGEIQHLTKILRPDIAIITQIGPAHIAAFPNQEAIASAKAEIFEGLSKNGTAIINQAAAFHDIAIAKAQAEAIQNIWRFGQHPDCEIYLFDIEEQQGKTRLKANVMGKIFAFDFPLCSPSLIDHIGAILGCLAALELDPEMFRSEIEQFPLLEGRGQIQAISYQGKSITLIDETYNANPLSMKNAIQKLISLPKRKVHQRKIMIIGDMLELGEWSHSLHLDLIPDLHHPEIDHIFLIGEAMSALAPALPNAESVSMEDMYGILQNGYVNHDDVFLLKASHAMQLDHIIQFLQRS